MKRKSSKKEWRLVHEICISDFSELFISKAKILHWAEVYARGAVLPLKDIQRLKEAFEDSKELFSNDSKEVRLIEMAIKNLGRLFRRCKYPV
jgi:hypothetical protein